MLDYNETQQILVDEMGLPLSHEACKTWMAACKNHLKKSPAQLARLAKETTANRYPTMVNQMTFSEETYK